MPSLQPRALLLGALALSLALPACRRRVGPAGRPPAYGGAMVGQPMAPTHAGVQWYPTSPPATGVTFRMPGYPQVSAQTRRAEDGAARDETFATTENPAGYFAVFVARWEAGVVGDPLGTAAAAATEIFRRANLDWEHTSRLAVTGYYAREDVGTNEHGARVLLRQFIGRDRVVVAISVTRADPAAVQIGTMFLQSIGLDRANALFPTDGARLANGEWMPFYMPEAEFAIAMPSAPRIEQGEVRIVGQSWPRSVFTSTDEWGTYRVEVIEFGSALPDDAWTELRQLRRFGRDVRPAIASGFPGRVFVTDVGPQRSWVRMFQTDGRIYVVSAVGGRQTLADQRVGRGLQRYFDSFRIL